MGGVGGFHWLIPLKSSGLRETFGVPGCCWKSNRLPPFFLSEVGAALSHDLRFLDRPNTHGGMSPDSHKCHSRRPEAVGGIFFPPHSLFWFEIMKRTVEAIWSWVLKSGKIQEAEQMPMNLYSCTKFDLVKGCGGGINLPYACGAFSSGLSCLIQENLPDRWRDLCQRLNIFMFSKPCMEQFMNSPEINSNGSFLYHKTWRWCWYFSK